MALPKPLLLSGNQRAELQSYVRKHNLPAAVAQRIRILLALADGLTYREIAETLSTTAPTISLWRKRYEREGIIGLGTIRPGQPPSKLTPALRARILAKTREAPPDGSTHWSLRKMAVCIGVGRELIRKVWKEADLKPHVLKRYMASNDPQFEQKAAEIIGLYMDPPQHAAVFCIDEKSAIQALDRLDRRLPLSPGRAERHGFEYYRHGTLSLFAALDPKTGRVIGQTAPRHTAEEFVAFLEEVMASCPPDMPVHIILDNLSVHKAAPVKKFLAEHTNVTFHFTPTYSSWLNQVEIWFSKLQRDVIDRGIFTSVSDLRKKIMRYIKLYGKTAKPSAGHTRTPAAELLVLKSQRGQPTSKAEVQIAGAAGRARMVSGRTCGARSRLSSNDQFDRAGEVRYEFESRIQDPEGFRRQHRASVSAG